MDTSVQDGKELHTFQVFSPNSPCALALRRREAVEEDEVRVRIHSEVCNNVLSLMPGDRPCRNFQHFHITDKHHLSAARARASCAASLPQPRPNLPLTSHTLPAARHACRMRPGTPSLTASTPYPRDGESSL
jgi:hypothetical protein